MNVNRKFDRFKQWAGERMGGEVKTNVTDDFKAMEEEMNHRHEGMDRLHKSMNSYVKSMSKTTEGHDKDRSLPVGHLGTVMIGHGEEFERDSEFGSCLISLGRANEAVARIQERYIARATTSWLESLERSLAQMKEYTAARKKLETRRLAYDASLSKMQKAKREDFRVEEELRAQKAKYEESNEDVYRRMQDIQESEAESIADLGAFLEAELEYHDRCREVLLKLKRDWPASQSGMAGSDMRRGAGNNSKGTRTIGIAYEDGAPSRPSIRSTKTAPNMSDSQVDGFSGSRTPYRQSSAEHASNDRSSYSEPSRVVRVPSDPITRSVVRPAPSRHVNDQRHWIDASDDSAVGLSSPERSCDELIESPTTSHGSGGGGAVFMVPARPYGSACNGKKAAPPPPPSRAKKPPPPPPPAKRSTLGMAPMAYSAAA